jgi:hypothetical protein
MGKPEGKGSLGRPMHKWEDNPEMELKYVGGSIDWCVWAQDTELIVGRLGHVNEPYCSIKS